MLRFELAKRIHGYIVRCEPKDPGASYANECGMDYWWDARREDWRGFVPNS